MKSFYQFLRELWKKPKQNMKENYKELLIKLRREPAIHRVERPTKLHRARALGYKAKQGVIVVRVRVIRGGKKKEKVSGGRRSKKSGMTKNVNKNYQQVAEERAARRFRNCEVLNSYFLAKDGRYAWYEVIMVDRDHPAIQKDKDLGPIARQRGRAFRGLTSAARKARGLRNKGIGAEKVRPSLRANKNKLH